MERPQVKWTGPGGQIETLELDRDEITVGRLSESDIVIGNPYVSRHHATIQRRDGDFYIVDTRSTHGTFVNGVRISERRLRHGDRISLGRDQVQLEFLTGDEPSSSLKGTLGDSELEKSVMQMTSVIPLAGAEASYLEKISHILNFQYHWEKSFSPESTFRQILDSSLKLSGAERGYILLKEDPGFKYVVGLNGFGEQLQEQEFRTSQTVVQEVATSGVPVLMTHNLDKQFENQQSILATDTRAIACMPLKWISTDSEEAEVRGILYLDSTKAMHALTGLDQKILTKLADEAANVFEKLEMIQAFEERKAYEKELALAQETQMTLLPAHLPEVQGFEIAAFSQATRHVGGDFYDFLPRQDSALTGVLADVSGKGVSAALLSSLVQGALQMECRVGASLTDMLNRVNDYLCEKSPSNRFVTLFLFSLDQHGKGHFLSAGHNPVYLYRATSGVIEELTAQDLILGAFSFARYSAQPMAMSPGDILVVYSDGVTEAMNPRDEMFSEERLTDLIRQNSSRGCRNLETTILRSIEEFTEGRDQTDDLTFLIVQKL
ncbi:MAG: SpoIIE family protein phosphatase [Acidobacteriota bacterium]